jgi:hypothetical protein
MPVELPNEPKGGFMLSTPWSLGFVLAVILGAMLVPGCRPEDGPSASSQKIPDQVQLLTTPRLGR